MMLRVKKALRAKIAGPFKAEALRTGEWTTVDLGDEGIIVGKDFYLVYVQTEDLANSPGLATDEDGEYSGRNWQYTDGSWSKAPSDQGNFMIRALVDYELSVPVITSPKDGFITNQKNAVIEGTSSPNTTVHLFNGDEEAGTAETAADGTFSKEIPLNKGKMSSPRNRHRLPERLMLQNRSGSSLTRKSRSLQSTRRKAAQNSIKRPSP